MARIDFLISNNRHHADMFEPVVGALTKRGHPCRYVSLCEFRGMVTPTERLKRNGTEVLALGKRVRSSPSAGNQLGGANSGSRRIARYAGWHLLLKSQVANWLAGDMGLVALPNDVAFPYDRIVAEIKRRKIPFVLVQEGIRFPLPAEQSGSVYGTGGAQAIAAWGKRSAEHFCAVGVAAERIHLTGNPRFDVIGRTDWRERAKAVLPEHLLQSKNLVFLSNPIDAQGFCTSREKGELVRRFAEAAAPLLGDSKLHLVFKLHPSEDPEPFGAMVRELEMEARATVLQAAELYPVLAVSQAAVVMASTAGLEALLFGLALGVVKIPGVGYVFDYVQGGAAAGLDPEGDMGGVLERMLYDGAQSRERVSDYMGEALAVQEGAGERLAELILREARV